MAELPAADERTEALVARALEAFDRGGEAALSTALRAEPELAARVRAIVARLTEFGLAGAVTVPVLPARIGGYRVLREIGRGGMGVVYAVHDEALGRHLALKVVRPELLAQAAARERFDREITALSRVQHGAIVPVVAAGNDAGLPFFVMPLVDGCSMEVAVQRLAERHTEVAVGADLHAVLGGQSDLHGTFAGPYWQAVVRLVRQVALGIQAAHERGVVHRDLKPSNVLLAADGRALVVDFGLAQVRGSVRLTRSGHEPGSPLWMAPEQVRGEPADERTDVYGLGATLWFGLARTTPFREADAESLSQRITAGLLEPLPSLAGPAELRLVLSTAMDLERARRYPSAAAFAADLDAVLGGRPIAARPLPWSTRAARAAQRHRAVAGAAMALLLALPLLLGVLWWRERGLVRLVREQRDRADATVHEFDLLAGAVKHANLLERLRDLHPPWPTRMSALQQWQHDATSLLAMQPAIERAVAQTAEAPPVVGSARQFLREALTKLQLQLVELQRRHVPNVARSLRWARAIGELSRAHPRARCTWPAARAAIAASPRYAGRELALADADVVGLVPIGCNPATQLWEFYDLRSAWDGEADPRDLPVPEHAPDGGIAVGETTGIVFVLLPGGDAELGAQAHDPGGVHFDPAADPDEERVTLRLAPFLLARHELTQAQWMRLCDAGDPLRAPSVYGSGFAGFGSRVTGAHPVEGVDWPMAHDLLERHGMTLPTEAQWEYACRSGTGTPWVVAQELLAQCANLADASCKAAGAAFQCESWQDGHVLHAPVGSLRANPFGLFDMVGNVFEWCLDEFAMHGVRRADDGLRQRGDGSGARVVRGASWLQMAEYGRSACRQAVEPNTRMKELGLRAARRLVR